MKTVFCNENNYYKEHTLIGITNKIDKKSFENKSQYFSHYSIPQTAIKYELLACEMA